MEEAGAIAKRLASLSTEGLVAIRTLTDASASATLDGQLDAERDAQRQRGRHPDYAEGVRAFMEKRAPAFRERP